MPHDERRTPTAHDEAVAEDRDHWRDHEYVSPHEDDINSAAAVERYEEWLGAGR